MFDDLIQKKEGKDKSKDKNEEIKEKFEKLVKSKSGEK